LGKKNVKEKQFEKGERMNMKSQKEEKKENI
jgi:hypothetical protein